MKHKLLLHRFFASLLLLAVSTLSWAYDFAYNGIFYNMNSDEWSVSVTYSSDRKYSGAVTIPTSVYYKGKHLLVTSIGSKAFEGCSGLTSITMPDSVTSIGDYAFYGCSYLTSITMPDSVTSIGDYAFYGCSGLTSITMPDSETSIGDYAFYGCSGLTSITIPNSVTSIGYEAFYGCSGLTSVTICGSETNIGGYAFYKCSGLTSITINSNAVLSKNYSSYNNNIRDIFGSQVLRYFIGNDVTSIGERVFYGCSRLVSVTIGNAVTSIDDYAFYGCSGLASVTIPNSVKSIGANAFKNSTALTSITIPNSVTSVGEYAFQNCSKLAVVCLPEKINIIKRNTFDGCSKLKEIVIPSSVQYIYQEAFKGCGSLESVKVLATTPPFAYDNTFSNYTISLLVPEESINNYKTTNPWSKFTTIKTLDGSDIDNPKCSTPTINYQNGQLVFKCETAEVEFKSSITDTDIKEYTSSSIQLNVTYNISVRATKTGYLDSDVATATLCWIDASPEGEGFVNGVAELEARPVILQTRGNIIDITGVKDGEDIKVYGVGGQLAGSAKASDESVSVPTTLNSGSIAIVKIGEKSVKIVMK